MAQTVLVTLTTAGADTGPFNLYSNIDGYVAPFATGVSKSSLIAGYLATTVPDGATTIRVKSQSVLCTNYVDLYFGEATTTTTTSSTSSSTSTTTSTTTSEDLVQVVLYARHDPAASTTPVLKFAYSTNGGLSWSAVGASFADTSCTQRAVISIQRNASLAVKITQDGNVTNTYQSARSPSGCPAFSSAACTWPAVTSNNTITYYFTVNSDNQGIC